MGKKLPKVFANKITKELNNNEKIYNSSHKKEQGPIEIKTKNKTNMTVKNKNINQKINEIINSKKYIYKIPVRIETETEEIITKIIGKNMNNIITIDNTLIKIETIKNIEIYEK